MRRLARDILLMASATLVSRVFGLVRDVTIADRFGAAGPYDAFLVAFFLPHFLRQLLAEGALSTAFVPVYTAARVADEDPSRFASNVLSWLVVLFPVVVCVGVLLAPIYLPFFASGFAPNKLALAVRLARLLFPFIALVGFAAVFMGILNAHHRFFVAALAPVMFNIGMIAGALLIAPRFSVEPILGLAVGVLIGGMGQLLLQIPPLRRTGLRLCFSLWPLHPGIRRMSRLMLPALIALAVTQINLMVDNKLASHLGDGGIASLQYAMRLFQLPVGVLAVSIATALLPRFSADVARGDHALFSRRLRDGLTVAALVLIPATAGLLAIGRDLIRLLFEHGSFGAADTLRTAHALTYYLVGILPYGWVFVLTRASYALGRSGLPVIASTLAVIANVACDLLLVGPMREGGLALATGIAGVLNATVLIVALRGRLAPIRSLLPPLTKVVVGGAGVYAVAWGVRATLPEGLREAAVFLPILAGLAFYGGFAGLTGLWRIARQSAEDPPA